MKIISRITIIAIAVSLSNAVVSQEKPLSQQVAATVLKIWPDTIPVGSQTKWSYDMGVVLKGFEGIWMNTGDISYLSLIHISEPTRLLSISYAVFCLKKKNT